jgi:WD40 repeat protein
MKTKTFLFVLILLALAGMERGKSQELPDTVWTKQLETNQKVHFLKFSPDGLYFYAGINNYIAKYETMTGHLIYDSLMHDDQIIRLDISPTGDTLLTSSTDGIIKLWNSQTGGFLTTTPVIDEYDDDLIDANFFDYGNFIICRTKIYETDSFPSFIIFGTKNNVKLHEFGEIANVRKLRVSPTNNFFCFTVWFSPSSQIPSKDYVYLYDLNTYEKISLLGTHDYYVNDIEFSFDGKYIASGGDDGKVKIWNVESRELAKELDVNGKVVRDIVFSKDNRHLLVGIENSEYLSIWIYDVENDFNKVYEYPFLTGRYFDIDNNSNYIISFGFSGIKGNYQKKLHLLYKKVSKIVAEGTNHSNDILYPNPTNNRANIVFENKYLSKVTINIYSLSGDKIVTILDEYLDSGIQSIQYDCSDLPIGTYIITINSSKFVKTYKLVKEG